jgi:hypothetical protein
MSETSSERRSKSWKTFRTMLLCAGAIFIAFIAIKIVAGIAGLPPLHIDLQNDTATVDIRTLSEYPTEVTRLVISSKEEGVLLNAVNDVDPTQIGKFTLHVGDNSPQAIALDSGRFKSLIPAGGKSFALRRGVNYQIQLWNKSASAIGYVKFH